MAHGVRARVFVSGGSQHVTIPRQFRFNRPVVYVSRDRETAGLLIFERPRIEEVFAALDAARLLVDFLGEAGKLIGTASRLRSVTRWTTLVLRRKHDAHPPGRHEHLRLRHRKSRKAETSSTGCPMNSTHNFRPAR